jgi:hypothetical protein
MSNKSQAESRDELLIELGFLSDPVRRLLDSPDYRQQLPFVEARLLREVGELYIPRLQEFVNAGGIANSHEHIAAHNAIHSLRDAITRFRANGDIASAKAHFDELLGKAKDALRSLPCHDAGQILPGLAPLSTYRRLLSVCRAATKRVDLFDPYLDKAVYLLYFDDVEPTVQITVVASEATMKETARRDRIVAVSELLALQRPDSYQLRVTQKQHDRHLRTDDQILHLGGSVKDAAKTAPYTISNLDSVQSNHAFLDDIIVTATEWVGPNVKKHRQVV